MKINRNYSYLFKERSSSMNASLLELFYAILQTFFLFCSFFSVRKFVIVNIFSDVLHVFFLFVGLPICQVLCSFGQFVLDLYQFNVRFFSTFLCVFSNYYTNA